MNRKRVLLVDDTETFLYILNHILKDEYETYIAKNGHDALEAAASVKPDLILLDVIMPGLSGYDVLKRLKENPDLKHIPVIMISGNIADESVVTGLSLGAADYVKKPFVKNVVKGRIDAVFGNTSD